MSQRLGSNINSPLFMIDPVPVRSSKAHGASPYDDQSLFIKGDDSSNLLSDNNNSSNISGNSSINGDEDIIIIDGPTESFQLHRKTLRASLEELKPEAHTPIRQLNYQHTECFRSVVEALRLLYGSQALYDLVLVDVRNVFIDVHDVKPGTVGAFFIGCFTDDKFPGPMGCSPKCAASLRPTEGTPGYDNCEDLVLIYSDGRFSSLNEKQSKHVYIYVGDENFKGFNTENINQLKDAGVDNASLIFGNPDGSYREVTGSLALNNLPTEATGGLPIVGPIPGGVTGTNGMNGTTDTAEGTGANTSAAVIFGIIILIIIVLFAVVLYRNYGRYWY